MKFHYKKQINVQCPRLRQIIRHMHISFNNTYVALPTEFYTKLNPTPVKQPKLIRYNNELGESLDIKLSAPNDNKLIDVFSGNSILEGSEPLAMAYAGHQFGGFSHQLGDGRANLLGEIIGADGICYDFQLKGSGRTKYSRGGDGRSALGPVLREYIVSEAMAKLGVPTTRALAAVTTGEEVARTSLVPGGILTRISKGFVRVGTFEYFAAKRDDEAIKVLADYEINRHYPEAKLAKNPYVDFLTSVVDRQAQLIAKWMQFGFIHGVMNTDNMSIVGETLDYGPCAFMDHFEHNRVFSSIDHQARYAYSNQPRIGLWNLTQLANALLPLLVDKTIEESKQEAIAISTAEEILNNYQEKYKAYWLTGMRHKLGLFNDKEGDVELVNSLLDCMERNEADFTLVFFHLSQLKIELTEADKPMTALFVLPEQSEAWLKQWRERLRHELISDADRQVKMRSVNPVYIPRNHQVEAAIWAAEDNNDFALFNNLLEVLDNPFEIQKGKDGYMLPPKPEEIVQQTFCGT